MIRRFGQSPNPARRYEIRHGAYAILPRNGQLLLTWQDEPHFEVQLPGGGVDPGESMIAALHREVLEETGWRISDPRRLGTFRRFVYMPEYDKWAEKICHIYMARPVRSLGPASEPGHLPLWMRPDHAVGVLSNDGDASFVSRLL